MGFDDVAFEDDGRPVPWVMPDILFDESTDDQRRDDGDREVLRAAFALLMTPAPAPLAAARVAMIHGLFYPALRPVDLVRLFHGVRRDDLRDARLELAALLRSNEKAETVSPVPALETSNTTTMYVEAPDA